MNARRPMPNIGLPPIEAADRSNASSDYLKCADVSLGQS
jgi:hypothetical protein